jgi:hypothetical protein
MGGTPRTMLAVLGDGSPRSVADIRALTGLTYNQARNGMNWLLRNNYVEPARHTRWLITRDGKNALDIVGGCAPPSAPRRPAADE